MMEHVSTEAPADERAATPISRNGDTPILQRLMDLELPLAVILGRAVLPIRDILKLTPGSMIELDRCVGELVDLMVLDKLVARAEIVSVKGNYGVRIKEIISPQRRETVLAAPVDRA
jgi:flagellar motor switch protein FliN